MVACDNDGFKTRLSYAWIGLWFVVVLEIAGTWSCRGSGQCSFGAFGSWTECQLLGSLPWCANWSFKGISVSLVSSHFWNAPYLYTLHWDQTCYCYYVAYFLIKHIVAIRLCNGIRRHKVYVIWCQSIWALNSVFTTTTLESLRKLVWSDQNFPCFPPNQISLLSRDAM